MNPQAFAASTRKLAQRLGLDLLLKKDVARPDDAVDVLLLGADRVDDVLKGSIPIFGCSREELVGREFLRAWALHAHEEVMAGLIEAESRVPEWFNAFDEAVYAKASPIASGAVFSQAEQLWRDPAQWEIADDLLGMPRKDRAFAAAALGILADALHQQEQGWDRMVAGFRPTADRSSPEMPIVDFETARKAAAQRTPSVIRRAKDSGAPFDRGHAAEG
jgi:hypothetical protein